MEVRHKMKNRKVEAERKTKKPTTNKPKVAEVEIQGMKDIKIKTVIEKPKTFRSFQWDGSKVSILPISGIFTDLEHYTSTKKGKFIWQIVTTDCGQVIVEPNDFILEAVHRLTLVKEYYLIDPIHIEFYEVVRDDSIKL
jgi:hypothetical protein